MNFDRSKSEIRIWLRVNVRGNFDSFHSSFPRTLTRRQILISNVFLCASVKHRDYYTECNISPPPKDSINLFLNARTDFLKRRNVLKYFSSLLNNSVYTYIQTLAFYSKYHVFSISQTVKLVLTDFVNT